MEICKDTSYEKKKEACQIIQGSVGNKESVNMYLIFVSDTPNPLFCHRLGHKVMPGRDLCQFPL